jgi:hypothetical protein
MLADLLFGPAARTGAFAGHSHCAIVVAVGQDVFVIRVREFAGFRRLRCDRCVAPLWLLSSP